MIADGDGQKVLFEIDSFIPKAFGSPVSLYNTTDDDALSNTIIMSTAGATTNLLTFDGVNYDNVTSYRAAPLTMSGFYSTPLNTIFSNPVILEAERYIDPLTADQIMNTRVINSVQLGGRYWVDTMAYNLTTGNSKMTLIKLP